MTQRQLDHPRNPRAQIGNTQTANDLREINDRLRETFNVVNNLPGTGPWLYVGKDTPFLGAWVNYSSAGGLEWQNVRFRRYGYDMVEIEGLARQTPYNAAASIMWRMPEGYIPTNNKLFAIMANGAGVLAAGRVDLYGYMAAGGVIPGSIYFQGPGGAGASDYVSLDSLRYSLS